jgi:hypothetical protein
MDDWTYNNKIKSDLAEKLSHLNISRNLMVQCLEIYYFLPIDKLELIYEGLTKKQKKARQGRAIFGIIEYKKNYL